MKAQNNSDEMKAARLAWEVRQAFSDTRRFCAQSLSIKDMQGRMVAFVWNLAQQQLGDAVDKQRRAGRPVRLIVLKSRRPGFSTGVAGILFKETAFTEGQDTLILAHEKKAAKNLFNIYDRFQATYKPFMGVLALDVLTTRYAGAEDGRLAWANGSSIEIATAKNIDFSRSFNFRRLHLSEYAFYPHTRELMTALIPTIPSDGNTIVIKESTASSYNAFFEDWENAASGKSDYEAVFFGCFDDPNNRRKLDEPPDRFQNSLTNDEVDLKHRYSLALEQLYWRRKKIEEYNGDEARFDQEYPHSAEVAFMMSGRPRFSPKLFLHMPVSDGVRGELEIVMQDRREERAFRPNPGGALTVWSHPEINRIYVGGCDPSKGVDISEGKGTPDPDYSTADIFDQQSFVQVAELRERIEPIPLARYLYDLGLYFNGVFWVIEVETNGGNGLAVIRELQRLDYPPHLIYTMQTVDEVSQRPTTKLGYQISGRTRNPLMAHFERLLYDRSVILRSRAAISEFHTFVKKADGRVEHQDGRHDDLVFSCMYAGVGLVEAPTREPMNRYHQDGQSSDEEDDYPGGGYISSRERAARAVYGMDAFPKVRELPSRWKRKM